MSTSTNFNKLYNFVNEVLLYKLDTLLLKQQKLPVLDIAHFFLCTSVFTWVVRLKKNPAMSNTDRFFCLNSTVWQEYLYFYKKYVIE
jgi:hypothetical protein